MKAKMVKFRTRVHIKDHKDSKGLEGSFFSKGINKFLKEIILSFIRFFL